MANEAERNGTEQNRAEKLRIRNEQTLDVSCSVGQRTSPAARETSDSQLHSSVFSALSRPPFLSSTEDKVEGLLVSGVLRLNQALQLIITPLTRGCCVFVQLMYNLDGFAGSAGWFGGYS